MTTDVDAFISHFDQRNGFARSHLFQVYLDINANPVKGVSRKGTKLSQLAEGLDGTGIGLQAQTASLPTKGLITKEIFTQNVPKPVGYNLQYSDLAITFAMDNNVLAMNIWNFMNAWMNMVVNPKTAFVGYHSEYSCDIHVSTVVPDIRAVAQPKHSNLAGKRPVRITFKGCFPKTMGEVSLDAGSSGDVLKLPVTFAITKFEDARWDPQWLDSTGASNQVTT